MTDMQTLALLSCASMAVSGGIFAAVIIYARFSEKNLASAVALVTGGALFAYMGGGMMLSAAGSTSQVAQGWVVYQTAGFGSWCVGHLIGWGLRDLFYKLQPAMVEGETPGPWWNKKP